jgi:hypothetical protein
MNHLDDSELEAMLRRHRPVGPKPALRERIVRPDGPRVPWWWLGAAAALLAIVVGSHLAIGSEVNAVGATLTTGADVDEQNPLLDLLGDDESARQLALFRMAEQQARRALDPPPPAGDLDGGGQ